MRVTAERVVTHLCPHVPERDYGTVTVSWEGDAVELHRLADRLDSFEEDTITHESLTQQVAAYVFSEGGTSVRVESRWITAGLNVTVTA